MDLSSAAATIRPRSYWAAVDLGVKLVGQWWPQLIICWVVITLPIYLVIIVLCEQFVPNFPQFGTVVFWWLLPFWERIHLLIISRGLFGELPTTKEVITQLPSLLRFQIIPYLLWRRLSPTRSFDLPVAQLEQLKGERYRNRVKLLHRDAFHVAFFWILVAFLFANMLSYGLLMVFYALLPSEILLDWDQILEADRGWAYWLMNGFYYLSLTLVTPYYVAGGFALYINRRIILEGWDIDLAFRSLAHRVEQQQKDKANRQADANSEQVEL